MKSEIPEVVSGTEFALFWGMSVAWVTKQIKLDMPHEGGGKTGKRLVIPFAAACQWVRDRARRESLPTESPRDRLAKEQGDRAALENAVRRGELCLKADVRSVVIGATLSHRSERNGIAGRLANELVGLSPAEIRAKILDELRRCDEQFSQRVGAFIVGTTSGD